MYFSFFFFFNYLLYYIGHRNVTFYFQKISNVYTCLLFQGSSECRLTTKLVKKKNKFTYSGC